MSHKIDDALWKLEGLHTVDTAAKELDLTRQSTINLLSKLKKQGHITVKGGGKRKRLYKITMRKQLPRKPGMFDILNKYSKMKLNPWYDHQVHGIYGPEEALIDAIETKSFRAILASLRLFNHIKDWKKLYRLAKEKDVWQQVGALYDVSRKYFKVKRMPDYQRRTKFKTKYLIRDYKTKELKDIYKKWKVHVPFRRGDIWKVKYDNA